MTSTCVQSSVSFSKRRSISSSLRTGGAAVLSVDTHALSKPIVTTRSRAAEENLIVESVDPRLPNVSPIQLRGQFRVPRAMNMVLGRMEARKRRATEAAA